MVKKILITGGAGYIGSVLTSFLLDKNYQVVVLDDLSVGKFSAVDKRSTFIEGSILDRNALDKSLNGVDLVIHCAAKSLVGESVEKPELYRQVNIEGTKQLLEAMSNQKVKNIIFSSSCAVYGQPEKLPITEQAICNPVSPYGQTKLACDELLKNVANSGMAAISFRFFNVGGSYKTSLGNWVNEVRDIETHLIPKLLKNLSDNTLPAEITVFGDKWETADGSCIRDYLDVRDLAAVHLLAINNLQKGVHKIYNLGSTQGSSVFEVIDTTQKVTLGKVNIVISDPRPGDPAVLLADISKAKNELNWSPKFTLRDIISSSWQGLGNT
jgi:UDP-glucose 4-epimerase